MLDPPRSKTNGSASHENAETKGRLIAPIISLPKGGGGIKGIGEKFAANPVTGTGALSIPLPLSPGRSGFTPALTLDYDSGHGNGPYGFGWNVSYPNITRRTDRGLPQYRDDQQSDVFILSGTEDLVPVLTSDATRFEELRDGYLIHRYRPRIEGLFARIERWSSLSDPSDVYWRSFSPDNTTTVFGRTAASRIADPSDPSRIFTWLMCETFDDKGNAAVYDYAAEDDLNVDTILASEQNRPSSARSANRYLKRVRYANRTSRLIQPDLSVMEWLLELVMDYGDHEGDVPSINPSSTWPVRPDSFSSYRSGFEVRTSRRCRRILMFHRFEELGSEPRLVRSLTLDYDDYTYPPISDTRGELEFQGSTRLGSFLRRVTVTGYGEDQNVTRSMPPLELTYSRPHVSEIPGDLDPASAANLPSGVDGARYQWVDLNSEGLSGVLVDEGSAWFYRSNLGQGRLGPQQLVVQTPSASSLAEVHLLDLAGDAQLDVVKFDSPNSGFYERSDTTGWSSFTPFSSQPNIHWDNPNLRFVDLTGDGHPDILITEDDVFSWYPSLGEEGFGNCEMLKMATEESSGPKLVFNDTTDTVFTADMSGDGLSDIVRIRNGEIAYWPNLGYGRFGRKVTMDNAPVFDTPELFDPDRLRLADIDGSGVVDVIYLAGDGVRIYFNRSGNGWTAPYGLVNFPPVDNVVSISLTDLLGNGTACLVWSTTLPGHQRAPVRYLDLMGNKKPHLLTQVENNLGVRTSIEYKPSTYFYLEDQLAGRPWIARLPFPVHVVERTEVYDDISRNRFVTRFAYHHGHYDGVEREFRGFGMVEQWDTEEFAAFNAGDQLSTAANVDASSHIPPVLTKTWFHTGAQVDRDHISNFFAGLIDEKDTGEYYREPGLTDEEAHRLLLEDTLLPTGLTAQEQREACRALKGARLRQEIYAIDGSDKEPHPYTVTEDNYTIRLLQPQLRNPHAVFLVHPRETIGYHYERNPADPRIAHSLTLETDQFGNVLKSAAIAYGRRRPDPTLELRDQEKQSRIHIIYSESRFTNAIDTKDDYRSPVSSETRSFALTGMPLDSDQVRFSFDQLLEAGAAASEIPYEQNPAEGVLQKRLIEDERILYRRNDLTASMAPGRIESLALPFEIYRLAFTSGLVSRVYGTKATDTMLADAGRYVHSEGDSNWWIPSGRLFYSPGSSDSSSQELIHARAHFFLPHRYVDPFHSAQQPTESVTLYDSYDLLLEESRDALGNTVTVGERDASGSIIAPGQDYRLLKPRLMTDPNGNRTAVSFDALGMVTGSSVMGKRDENPRKGDLLDDFIADLPEAVVLEHIAAPLNDPHSILNRATTRVLYDLFAYLRTKGQESPEPAVTYTQTRENHDADLAPGEQTKIQHAFSYSDGFGREIQVKQQAEPGPVALGGPSISPRWSGSGWTIFNNKGKPTRQFEPFFSETHRFEFEVMAGVSSLLFYDPAERLVATLHPNHSWEKRVFDAWRSEDWDANDTATIPDAQNDPDVGDYFRRLQESEYLPTWTSQRLSGAMGPDEKSAAEKIQAHGSTPLVAFTDVLARRFLTISHNRFNENAVLVKEFLADRIDFDIEGNERAVTDSRDRTVVRYDYDVEATQIHRTSMEAGERWLLNDVAGRQIFVWDSRNQQFRTTYDALGRPIDVFLTVSGSAEQLVSRTTYGEDRSDAEEKNLRGKVVQIFDQAGVVTNDAYDFKGNPLISRRRVTRNYKDRIDWSDDPALETEEFVGSSTFDALNRPVLASSPDGSIYRATFNEANLLAKIDVNVRASQTPTTFVTNIDYDARGERTRIDFGNGASTFYEYDPLTLHLTRLKTMRPGNQPVMQDLIYTFDPVGNISHIRDNAHQPNYFNNQVVTAENDYTYDAIYRLIGSTGREHIGQVSQPQTTWDDRFRVRLPHRGDGQAMRRYSERYKYDDAGNFVQLVHSASGGDWTRSYEYSESSLLEPSKPNNRLSRTLVGTASVETYSYDAHGSTTEMPHLSQMDWDFRDQLQGVDLGGGGKAHYVYDSQGRRIRKVIERNAGALIEETIYLGGFEIFRRRNGAGTITLERETLHVSDDRHSMAIIETRTKGNDGSPAQLIRYQFDNHLGSASLELDESCQVISYEEYYPYGSTSYQSVRSQTETPRRYRYSGMERDEESGLNCHGARYYASWLGRWTSCDPSGIDEGPNLFLYVNDSPIQLLDTSGNDSEHCGFPVNDDYKYKIGITHCMPMPLKKRKGRGNSSGKRSNQKRQGQGQGQGKGKGDGSTGGKPGGKKGGIDGGTATKTPTGRITEAGAGDGPGGLGEPGDVGSGDLPGTGTEGEGNPTGTGTGTKKGAKPGDQGDPEGAPGGKKGGKKKASGGGEGEGQEKSALDHLSELAALLDDPESLYEAKKSGNKGKGAAMGNKSGFIEGEFAQFLAIVAVIGGLVWGFFKGLFKKGFDKIKNKIRGSAERKALPKPQKALPEGKPKIDAGDEPFIQGKMEMGKTRKEAEQELLELKKEFPDKVDFVPGGPNSGGILPFWRKKKK